MRLPVEAAGRAGTENLIATFTFAIGSDGLDLQTASIEDLPGSGGGDTYTNSWTDTSGTQEADLVFFVEETSGFEFTGGLSGSVRGTGAMDGVLVELHQAVAGLPGGSSRSTARTARWRSPCRWTARCSR